MPSHTATFSPAGWTEAGSGVWTKDLLQSRGDSFTLVRLGAGAALPDPGDRVLVLEGTLAHHRAGAYLAADGALSSPDGCLALSISGERLGEPAEDVFGPSGWQKSSPGLWFRLLLDVAFDETFDERVVGLSYFEPGSFSARHPHPTAHRFLFLDGEADDELVFPDGSRVTARRARGDFVDYPAQVEHQTFSRGGCLILFLHEPAERS
ncbi:cupin domain-containing protein [Amycolatopsis sp. NPDC059090]|uniref:cupin domain-containing protein n=1 Tax=unclassified Amycolatopsis TaxID=2618356 RepID=UPI00366ACC9A